MVAEAPASPAVEPPSSPEAPPAVIGQWRDVVGTAWDVRLTLMKTGDAYTLRVQSLRGKPTEWSMVTLPSMAGEVLRLARSEDSEDIYAVRRTGELAMFDADGYVRSAQPVK